MIVNHCWAFHDIGPRLAVIKVLSYLCTKLHVAGRIGCTNRFRDQWLSATQWRPRAHSSFIKESRIETACLMNEPRETPTRS